MPKEKENLHRHVEAELSIRRKISKIKPEAVNNSDSKPLQKKTSRSYDILKSIPVNFLVMY